MSDKTEVVELDEDFQEKLEAVLEETPEESEAALPEDTKKKLKKAKKSKKVVTEEEIDPAFAKLDKILGNISKGTEVVIGRATTGAVSNIIRYDRSPFGMANLNALMSASGIPEEGGAPHGRFVVLSGSEGCCKTTLAMECIARRLATYPDEYALILDAENAVDADWAKHFGVDLDRVIVIPGTIPLEDMGTYGLRTLKACREQGIKISMCLIDSLGAMAPAVELEGKKSGRTKTEADLRTDHVATSARKINQLLRTWAPEILKSNTCCFLIAHMMVDIGGYGGRVMKGGLGLRHFAHFIIELRKKFDQSFEKVVRGKDGEERKIRTGYFVEAKLKKARSPYEGHSVSMPFLIGVGFATTMSLLNTAIGFGIIEKAGSWFKYQGESIGQGQAKAINWLDENHEQRVRIQEELSTAMYEDNQE